MRKIPHFSRTLRSAYNISQVPRNKPRDEKKVKLASLSSKRNSTEQFQGSVGHVRNMRLPLPFFPRKGDKGGMKKGPQFKCRYTTQVVKGEGG